ncbi:MAG: tetratricopeptide repeat protein [Candidatus Marinimicrobia bacterium]|nr:tetratricopeptide repeat protein [Candidatus Neomarinimicrobiota bacterium]
MRYLKIYGFAFFVLISFLYAQDIDVMKGIQRRDTTRTLAPMELDEIPDYIGEPTETSEADSELWRKTMIDSLENQFSREKERLETNFQTTYEYKLSRAIDSIRFSLAYQIQALESEVQHLRNQVPDTVEIIYSSYQQERDSLLHEIVALKKMLISLKAPTISAYSPDALKREQAYYTYLFDLMKEEKDTRFLLKADELSEIKEKELWLYLDIYFPDLNSGEVLIQLARVYEDEHKISAAKLTYLKYLFFFPDSVNRSYIKKQIEILIERDPDPHDILLSEYLMDTRMNALEGSPHYLYLRAMADIGYPDCEFLFEREIRRFQQEEENPNHVSQALIWFADMLTRQKHYQLAISQLKKVVTVYPESSYIPQALYMMAGIYRNNLGESQKAADIYEQIRVEYPKNFYAPKALLIRASIQEKEMKDFVAALSDYEKVVANYPGTLYAVEALKNMGRIYRTLSKSSDLAIRQYETIKREYGFYWQEAAEAMITLAELYEEKGDYDHAVKEILELYERYPNYEKVPNQLLKAASLREEKLGDKKGAKEIYTIVIAQYPETRASEKARKVLAKVEKE